MSDTESLVMPKSKGIVGSVMTFLCTIPTTQLIAGIRFHNDCPRQPLIPIYLEAMGSYCLVLIFLSPLTLLIKRRAVRVAVISVSLLLLFGLFITGNVWIYSIYEPNYNKKTTDVDPYCRQVLYLIAFWTTTLSYIIMGLFVFGCCCCVCCFCMQTSAEIETPT